MRLEKTNFELKPGVPVTTASIETKEDPKDASILADIVLTGDAEMLAEIRQDLRQTRRSVSLHAVNGTIDGKSILELFLARMNNLGEVQFPRDWDLDVEVREVWPQKDGIIKLLLNGGQDADGVAHLLRSVGIKHDYDG